MAIGSGQESSQKIDRGCEPSGCQAITQTQDEIEQARAAGKERQKEKRQGKTKKQRKQQKTKKVMNIDTSTIHPHGRGVRPTCSAENRGRPIM